MTRLRRRKLYSRSVDGGRSKTERRDLFETRDLSQNRTYAVERDTERKKTRPADGDQKNRNGKTGTARRTTKKTADFQTKLERRADTRRRNSYGRRLRYTEEDAMTKRYEQCPAATVGGVGRRTHARLPQTPQRAVQPTRHRDAARHGNAASCDDRVSRLPANAVFWITARRGLSTIKTIINRELR